MFKNPKLSGALILKYVPELAKPMVPVSEIKKPIAAELPIAILIGYPNILNIGVLYTPPPIPMGADKNPDKKPQIIL